MALLNLPNETLHTIISWIPDGPSLLAMMRTCKRIYLLFSHATKNAAKLWELIRIKEGWPSPDLIGMTDYGFLRAYYGQGCDYCPSLTRATPRWEFSGLRLCQDCILASTIAFDDLSTDSQVWTLHAKVPFWHRISTAAGRGKRKKWQELYLRESVPGRAPTGAQSQAGIRAQRFVKEFQQVLEENERKRSPVEPIITRRKIIDDIVKEMFPEIRTAGALYDLKTYVTAYHTYTVFTPRSQATFRRKMFSEIEAKRAEVTKKQREVRDTWTKQYLVTPHLRKFGKATELFSAANENQEDEFRQMIAAEQNREHAKKMEFARQEFGNNTKNFIFYCANCDYCLGAGANAKMMQVHFEKSKRMCSIENLGIRDE